MNESPLQWTKRQEMAHNGTKVTEAHGTFELHCLGWVKTFIEEDLKRSDDCPMTPVWQKATSWQQRLLWRSLCRCDLQSVLSCACGSCQEQAERRGQR